MENFDKEEFMKILEECAKKPPMISLHIDEDSSSVELILDTKSNCYSEWIKGEGADICLYREFDTERVVGCRLPLYQTNLIVSKNLEIIVEPKI